MRAYESMRSSVRNLFRNRLRSLLTMLGVIIGVSSVILLTSIGEGVKRQVTSQVESLGANLLYVFPGQFDMHRRGESRLGVRIGQLGATKSTLTYQDVLAMRGLGGIGAITGFFPGVDRLDDLNLLVSTTGVDEDLPRLRKLDLAQGRFFDREDRLTGRRVAVIGDEANREIFGGGKSVGHAFRLNGQDYLIRGVLRYKKPQGGGPMMEDINIRIYLPITTAMLHHRIRNLSQIMLSAKGSGEIDAVEKRVGAVLRRRHGGVDFTVLKQQDILDAVDRILSILTAALGGIAGISLVVGGIGIMNIMLVAVTERTKEIGVRKSIGAKRRDIMLQFLVESAFLSICGGLLGLSLGIALSRLLPRVAPGVPTAVSLPAAVIALLSALAVGLFFGVFPAARAARLDPIAALRSE